LIAPFFSPEGNAAWLTHGCLGASEKHLPAAFALAFLNITLSTLPPEHRICS
jgi:hypothetical protein